MDVLQGGVVSTSPNPEAGGPPLVGCPRLIIQFIRSYPPYRRMFLYPQPEDVPCRGDRDCCRWRTNETISITGGKNVLCRYIFFVMLVSLYAEQLTISSCVYWFDVSNIAFCWVRVTILYEICLFFCFSCVKLLLDNVNKIWNEVGPSEGTFISS